MSKLQSPLRWIGGKFYLAPWHVSRFPMGYECLLIPFAGGMSEIFQLPYPTNVIANDTDSELINFWDVVRDRTSEFVTRCQLTPLSRELVERLASQFPSGDPIDRAWRFFILNRQSFSGTGTGNGRSSWSISTRIRRDINESTSALISSVELLWEVSQVLRTVAVDNQDFEAFIITYSNQTHLRYCDPPYYLGENNNTYYSKPFTKADHYRLASVLKRTPGPALVCNYVSDYYHDLYRGWRMETKPITIKASTDDVKATRQEAIWMNY